MLLLILFFFFFFFQAEDGIRDLTVTGVHVCSSDLPRSRAETDGSLPAPARARLVRGQRRARSTRSIIGKSRPRSRTAPSRSEERRVGKECRSGWSPDH